MKKNAVRAFALALALLMIAALFPLGAFAEEGEGEVCAHDYVTQTRDPSCTEAGWTAQVCSLCGDRRDEAEIPALGHALVPHEAQDPTCAEAGWAAYETCERCTYSTFAEIPALGHDWADGVCTRCGVSCAHSFAWKTVRESTCTESGLEAEVCTVCGMASGQERSLEPLGHVPAAHEAKDPTCTEVGWDAYESCERCDYTGYVEKPALGHDWLDGVCTRCEEACAHAEYREGLCTVCGAKEPVAALLRAPDANLETVSLTVTITGEGSVTLGEKALVSGEAESVEKGAAVSLTFTPAEGWELASLTVNGEETACTGTWSCEALEEDAALALSFRLAPLVTVNPGYVVPDELKENEAYNTVEKIEAAMLAKAREAFPEAGDKLQVFPYDITAAMPDGSALPEKVSFLLAYPEGLNAKDFDYAIFHLKNDGTLETLSADAQDDGIHSSSGSFSPVALAAALKDAEENTLSVSITPAEDVTVGTKLSAIVTPEGSQVRYLWSDGEKDLGTEAEYTVTEADVGKPITCTVTEDTEENPRSATSNAVTPTEPEPEPPEPPEPPAGLKTTQNVVTVNGGLSEKGVVSGTTADMEYAVSPDAESWTPVTGTSFSVSKPGTYYVRYKATDTVPAGKTASVTVKEDAYYTISTRVLYGHGSIKPMKTLATDADGNYLVKAGDDVVFVFTGSRNYSVASVRVDGTDAGTARTYTFKNVREPYELGVGFKYTGIGPRTGDGSRIELWCGAEALSLLALLGVALFLRKLRKA